MASQEYLRIQLRFTEKDIEGMKITDTQVSAKGVNILYVVTNDENVIRDIRQRMAQCQDPDLQSQDFIPPQYYKRYIALSRYAQDMRYNNMNVKTQIRYGTNDIELWTKDKRIK